MRAVVLFAAGTGFAVWGLALWALANRAVTLLARIEDERRRRKNARRLAGWRPPRYTPGPGHDDVTRVLPGIQRPKGP
jgi:hypothetical protein